MEPNEETHRRIAERAYAIWIAEGCPQGCDRQHWFRAEAEQLATRSKTRFFDPYSFETGAAEPVVSPLHETAAQK